MTRLLRWLGIGLLLAVVLVGLGFSFVYVSTEPLIRRTYNVALRPIAVPTDAASIAEGKRLAIVRGCFNGCHGQGVEGYDFHLDPWIGRMVAPELTQVIAKHSDSELERVIRQGVRKNGRSTWGMPSSMFYHLTDADLGKIIAFLRTLPAGAGPQAEIRIGPGWRIDLLHDRYLPMVEEIRRDAPWLSGEERRGEHGEGRYLALTVCTECHGMNLEGAPDGSAPNLAIVAAYSESQFRHLMKTGEPIGGRELDLMDEVARVRFSQLTDAEVLALYNYLSVRSKGTP